MVRLLGGVILLRELLTQLINNRFTHKSHISRYVDSKHFSAGTQGARINLFVIPP